MTYTDWNRKRAYVRPAESAGEIRWVSSPVTESYAVFDAAERTVIVQESGGPRWWTWAGARTNAVLVATLAEVSPELLDDLAYSWSGGEQVSA